MRRRHGSRKHPAARPTWCSDRTPAKAGGTISASRHVTYPSAVMRPKPSFGKFESSSTHPSMNVRRLKTCWHKLPKRTLRELQAKRLRAYLRDVVLPFHSHYRDLFRRHRLAWRAIENCDDLHATPFPSEKHLQR